MTPLALAVGRA